MYYRCAHAITNPRKRESVFLAGQSCKPTYFANVTNYLKPGSAIILQLAFLGKEKRICHGEIEILTIQHFCLNTKNMGTIYYPKEAAVSINYFPLFVAYFVCHLVRLG